MKAELADGFVALVDVLDDSGEEETLSLEMWVLHVGCDGWLDGDRRERYVCVCGLGSEVDVGQEDGCKF